MKRKLLGGVAVLACVFAFAAPNARADSAEYQMMKGPVQDPNVYCNGGCATKSCCIVG